MDRGGGDASLLIPLCGDMLGACTLAVGVIQSDEGVKGVLSFAIFCCWC